MPAEILNPSNQWSNKNEYYSTLMHLAELYKVTLPAAAILPGLTGSYCQIWHISTLSEPRIVL